MLNECAPYCICIKMSGVAVTTVAVWTIAWKHQFVSLLETKFYIIISYVLLSAGLLSIATVFLGCYGIRSDKKSAICLVSRLDSVIVRLVLLALRKLSYFVALSLFDGRRTGNANFGMFSLGHALRLLFHCLGTHTHTLFPVCPAIDCNICFGVFGGQRNVCVRNANRRRAAAIAE